MKKRLCICILVAWLAALSACQPTPEPESFRPQDGGYPEDGKHPEATR